MSANLQSNLESEIPAFRSWTNEHLFNVSMRSQALVSPLLTREIAIELPPLELNPSSDCILAPQQYAAKRALDLFLAGIAALVFALPMLIISILVKSLSKGPIFYGQERIGLGGKPFTMWKFRSMKVGAEDETGAVWAIKNDPRRTRFGSFLRATSLDELPQLWNVFVGEMSLVGPRPERPPFVKEFRKEIPNYMARHQIPVGITGWAQINGWRGDTSIDRRVEHDLEYVKNWSLLWDLKILALTALRGFIHPNAY